MEHLVEAFRTCGFVRIRQAFDAATACECRRAIEAELRARSVEPADPSTWRDPVVRFACPAGPAFEAAARSPALEAACDALLGHGNWLPRTDGGVGGTVPVRFPGDSDPGDAGWHIDGSYELDGEPAGRYFVNVHSRGRALLALFLFTDITQRDAPTEIIVGSQRDLPRVLRPFGERGAFFGDVMARLPASVFRRPRAFATGVAGDVYLCHPFLVHRATFPHRGERPRMLAQPAVAHAEPFRLVPGEARSVVEEMILAGLADG